MKSNENTCARIYFLIKLQSEAFVTVSAKLTNISSVRSNKNYIKH